MPIIPANIGYLKGVVLKELSAGRKCEITGGVYIHIDNCEDYELKKQKLIGKFGEVVTRNAESAFIATRSPPPWAEKKIDEVIWDCEEMIRWDVGRR